jgi:hypothetical protein
MITNTTEQHIELARAISVPHRLAPAEQAAREQANQIYEAVSLTEQETAEALLEGKKKKYFQMRRMEYYQQLMHQAAAPRYTARQLFEWLTSHHTLTVDKHNQHVLRCLALYFSADPRFAQMGQGYSLDKGLLLQGGVGVGKTTLMKIFQVNQHASYRVVSCYDIANQYSQAGPDHLAGYITNASLATGANKFGHQNIGYCFDDLGVEDRQAMHYGSRANVMEQILWGRYNAGLFSSTHITTNAGTSQLAEWYGERVHDRFREMFNQVTFPAEAKSRR